MPFWGKIDFLTFTAQTCRSLPSCFAGSLIRLVSGYIDSIGFIETRTSTSGSWGAVCGDYTSTGTALLTTASAQVACRQLGLPWSGATSFAGKQYFVNASGPGTQGTSSFLMPRLLCAGWEAALGQCPSVNDVVAAADGNCSDRDAGEGFILAH